MQLVFGSDSIYENSKGKKDTRSSTKIDVSASFVDGIGQRNKNGINIGATVKSHEKRRNKIEIRFRHGSLGPGSRTYPLYAM